MVGLDVVVRPLPHPYLPVREVRRDLPVGYSLAQDRFRRGEKHMANRDPAGGETAEDLVTVVLAEQCHGDHEYAPEFGEHRGRGVDHEPSPDRQVLEVADLGEALGGQELRQPGADELGVEECAVRDQVDQFPCGGGLPRTERTVDPNDHGSPSAAVGPLRLARSTLPRKPGPEEVAFDGSDACESPALEGPGRRSERS